MVEPLEIPVDVPAVARYFFWMHLLFLIPGYGRRWARLQAERLSYCVEGETLRADSGLIWFQRKSVPLNKITDINLTQGPVARRVGFWVLSINTAGSPRPYPEVVIYGPADPEGARDALLERIGQIRASGRRPDDGADADARGA
jgi:membrane protein YdbS with pleckstrin-like domain